MAEEIDKESKTEDPSPRRREEARQQGRMPFSAELVGSVVLLAGCVGLSRQGPEIWDALQAVFREEIPRLSRTELESDAAQALLARPAIRALTALSPLFGMMLVAGVSAAVAQTGFQINTERFEPNFDRLNPASGFQKLASPASLIRAALAVLKVIAIGLGAYLVLEPRGGMISAVGHSGRLSEGAAAGWAVVTRLILVLTSAVAAIAVLDYLQQRRQFEASLRMTKQEVKDELKREEGDPQLKARVRQLQRERGRRRAAAEVPKAAVVLTNPTHYAVALRYHAGRDAAPVVAAKGAGVFAKHIVMLARQAGVPVVERPAVARALYSGAREGRPIPTAMFRAVAEVLAFVYRLRNARAA